MQHQCQHHRALSMPEIVELLLSYTINSIDELFAPPPSKNARRYKRPDIFREQQRSVGWCPLLVCKQWFAIGMRLRLKKIEWLDTNGHTLTKPAFGPISLKVTVSALNHHALAHEGSAEDTLRWRELCVQLKHWHDDAVDAPAREEESNRRRADRREATSMSRICELSMDGIQSIDYVFHVVPLVSSSLTLLNLDFVRLTRIDICALLTDDSTESGQPCLRLPHLRHILLTNVIFPMIPVTWLFGHQPSRLKTLAFMDVASDYESLCHLLTELCGPCLETFRLGRLTLLPRGGCGRRGFVRSTSVPFELSASILEHLSSLSPRVYNVYLHTQRIAQMEDIFQAIRLFPHARTVRIAHPLMTITAMLDYVPVLPSLSIESRTVSRQSLALFRTASRSTLGDMFQEHATTNKATGTAISLHLAIVRLFLECDFYQMDRFDMAGFNQFMCSPDARYLQELVAPDFQYPARHIDAEQRQLLCRWQCSKLEVLAIGFGATQNGWDADYAAYARQLFGFVTVYCPILRYLELRRTHIQLRPEGGFCFLTRLPNLERLVLRMWSYSNAIGGGGGGNGGGSGSGNSHKVKVARWMRTRPSWMEVLLGQSSLAMCRRIAKQDKGRGHFGTPEGHEVLWPSKNKAEEGARWDRLCSLVIHTHASSLGVRRIEEEMMLMKQHFPHIDFVVRG